MTISTGVLLRGIVDVDIRRRDGSFVEQRRVSNRIVDYGLDMMSRLLVAPFVNETRDNVSIRPIEAIAVGTFTHTPGPGGSLPPVGMGSTGLDLEWTRKRIEEVEIIRAALDIRAAGGTDIAIKLSSRVQGAYGNRIAVTITSAVAPYGIRIDDQNQTYWNGTAWVQGPAAPRPYTGNTLAELLSAMAFDPAVSAHAPDLSWEGTLESLPAGATLRSGGTGVIVAATFTNPDATTRGITEAALFTSEDAADPTGRIFNLVRFPVISVTSTLDVTFRWKLIFQET